MNNQSIIHYYFNAEGGPRDRHCGHLLIEGGVLYSYGHHFALAVAIKGGYLLNGDRYSVTTSQHQSIVRHEARECGGRVCLIPFSALAQALDTLPVSVALHVQCNGLTILDVTEDEYRSVEYTDPKTGERKTRTEHLLGSVLFEYRGDKYLSSTDPTGKWGRNYFLTKLRGKPGQLPTAQTVAEAYEALKPGDVKWAEKNGLEVKRQGEYFFIPWDFPLKRGLGKQVVKNLPLPPADNRLSPHEHVPTETYIIKDDRGDVRVVRGTVRHRGVGRRIYGNDKLIHDPGDHKMLKLGKVWHIVVPNVQAGSWSVNGRVD